RLFRMGRYSGFLVSILTALRKSGDALLLCAILVSISLVLNSALLFFAEQTVMTFDAGNKTWYYNPPYDREGVISPFQSIYQAFWWGFTTLCFLAYGNEVPRSPLGRSVVLLTVICAVVSFAIPLYVVLHRVAKEMGNYRESKTVQRLKDMPSQDVLLTVFA